MAIWLDIELKGEPGPAGEPGVDGADGSAWRDGEGAPSNGLGVDGDYYLDRGTGNVYKRASGVYAITANIQGPEGESAADVVMPWSPVDYMSANPNDAPVATAGSNTTGILFAPTRIVTIAGARFWWAHASAATIKVSLWTTDATAGHVRQRNVSVPVNGVGLYTATFASTYTTLNTTINRGLFIAMWETTGTRFTHCSPNTVIMPAMPFIAGAVHFQSFKSYNGGDTEPTSTAGSEHYPIEPTFA